MTALDADDLGGPGSEFPHPHVRGETLCEGEGMRSIASALRSGRLLDFFEIVRRILQTYNAGSAYVQLARWHGRECRDCGDVVTEDESTSCERCGRDLCLACSVTCGACRGDCCGDCRGECAACDEPLCDRCAVWCDDCDGRFCPDCLVDGACASCRNLENQPDDAIPETATPENENQPPAAAAVLRSSQFDARRGETTHRAETSEAKAWSQPGRSVQTTTVACPRSPERKSEPQPAEREQRRPVLPAQRAPRAPQRKARTKWLTILEKPPVRSTCSSKQHKCPLTTLRRPRTNCPC